MTAPRVPKQPQMIVTVPQVVVFLGLLYLLTMALGLLFGWAFGWRT